MRFCKFVLSLLLLPPVCLVGWETGRMVWGVLGHFQTAAGFFLGAVVYAAIHYGCYNFSRPYVLVHEMTHALAALLCGSRVKDFSVKKESGYVKLDKANMFINLMNYCEQRKISVFKYVPFTIVFDLNFGEKEKRKEIQKYHQEQLEKLKQFIEDTQKYVVKYENIGN